MTTSTNPETPTFDNILFIGLSGPSSSGKTTLARLLRSIFNISSSDISISLFILHEDDFYKTDVDIPTRTISSAQYGTRLVQDWDCTAALNLPLLERVVKHVKSHGVVPAGFESMEDQNSVGDVGVTDDEVEAFRTRIVDWLLQLQSQSQSESNKKKKKVTVCILDGFLLFPAPPDLLVGSADADADADNDNDNDAETKTLYQILSPTLDLKLFLPATKHQTLTRRANRSGYVTLEGFWADPPGYVEDLVWPNYARDHAWLFQTPEDVDVGRVWKERVEVVREGIVVGPGPGESVSMKGVLDWGVNVTKGRIERVLT